jgi:hypothetical protein
LGVIGDIAWRKWHGALTDEVPTLFSVLLMEISVGYKAKPKCWRYATVSTGLSPTLALWGPQRVRRRSAVTQAKRTHLRK